MVVTPAVADLILNFDNDRPDASTLPAYITFTGALPGQFDATIAGTSTQLQQGVSYSLSTLAAGVDVTKYTSGRVFVSLGSPLIDLSAGNQYAPNFEAAIVAGGPNPNFLTRMDKYEITYGPSATRRSDRRRQSELDRFLWHPSAAADKRRQSADDAHLELQRRRQHGRGLPDPRRPGELPDRHSCRHPRRPRRRRRERRHDQHAGRTLTGVVRIIAPSTTNGGTTPYPSFANYLNYIQTQRDLGHDRGSERTILERRTVPEL